MKLTNLTKVYILKPTKTKVDGEVQTIWTKISSCNVNIQQDYNELDKNTSGTIDYSIYNIRINKDVRNKKWIWFSLFKNKYNTRFNYI